MEHGILVKKQQISSCKVPQPVAQFDGYHHAQIENNQRAGSVYTLKVSRFMAAERAIRLSGAVRSNEIKISRSSQGGGSSYELFRLGEIRSRYRKRRVQRPHKRAQAYGHSDGIAVYKKLTVPSYFEKVSHTTAPGAPNEA
ncbi:hypothetical protein EVAR_44118_1 [Eumeta japonica]|uniref:Uncharacterized protein n=1 Tax=Eumeta variegata TaxID=151549 RepID=A0A4C2A0A2_EUMVA|nr:hypothetical protein EVAR_44118_1 [Eumeta japonica]